MSNNKQSMKLYTEEELRKHLYNHDESFFEKLTPIELPSDDEIKKIMEFDGMEIDEFDPYDLSYLGGAIWMRNKIQGGNNEH